MAQDLATLPSRRNAGRNRRQATPENLCKFFSRMQRQLAIEDSFLDLFKNLELLEEIWQQVDESSPDSLEENNMAATVNESACDCFKGWETWFTAVG